MAVVLKSLRSLLFEEVEEEDAPPPAAPGLGEDERGVGRCHDFTGYKIIIRDRRTLSLLHLKDLSCTGASGISDMPVAVGSVVFLEVRRKRFNAATVRWVKSVLIGLEFIRPLKPEIIDKAYASHRSRLAAAAGKGAARPAPRNARVGGAALARRA